MRILKRRFLPSWTSNLLLAACALGAAALLAESFLYLRSFNGYCVWPPNMRRTLTPGADVMPGIVGASRFSINSRGIRGRDSSRHDEYRILAIGGSTTECLYLDDDETWPALVEKELNSRLPGRRVWVGNVGKSGFNTRNHLWEARKLLRQTPHPDTVLLMVGINDMALRLSRGEDWESIPVDSEDFNEIVDQTFAVFPRPPSSILELREIRRRFGVLARRIRGKGDPTEENLLIQDESGENYVRWRRHRTESTHRVAAPPDLTGALEEYRNNLIAIAGTARDLGVRVVFATQPTIWRDGLPDSVDRLLWVGGVGRYQEKEDQPYYTVEALASAMDAYNGVLSGVCREQGVDCVDLASMIPKDTTVFYDDCHFNEDGARAVAGAIADVLSATAPLSARADSRR